MQPTHQFKVMATAGGKTISQIFPLSMGSAGQPVPVKDFPSAQRQCLNEVAKAGMFFDENGGTTFYPPNQLSNLFCQPVQPELPRKVTVADQKGIHRVK
jgi:hypothetical protein